MKESIAHESLQTSYTFIAERSFPCTNLDVLMLNKISFAFVAVCNSVFRNSIVRSSCKNTLNCHSKQYKLPWLAVISMATDHVIAVRVQE